MTNEIHKPSQPTHFAAHNDDGTVSHVGITHPNQVTTSGQPHLTFSDDPEEFLAATAEVPMSDLPPLPQQGEHVAKGVYEYQGKRVVARQEHTRTEHAVEDVPALFVFQQVQEEGQPPVTWMRGELVPPNHLRTCPLDGNVYRQQQPNKILTVEGQEPSSSGMGAVWLLEIEVDGGGSNGYPAWQQPTGAHDAPNIGDRRTHNGRNWESKINANTTEPGSDPRWWEDLGEA